MNRTSEIHEMEMLRLDQEIEKTRKQFYTALLGKKRRVKRKWLEISAMTNAHLLQTLPYRAMLGHVAKLAEERDKFIAEAVSSPTSDQQLDRRSEENVDDGAGASDHDIISCIPNSKGKRVSPTDQHEHNDVLDSKPAQDEAIQTIQTKESSLPNPS